MSPLSALKLMVQHHPLGRDGIANLLGKTSETLRQELGGYPGFKMGVVDACVISELCISSNSEHCHAYANTVALNCGGFVQLPVRETFAPVPLGSSTVGLVSGAAKVLADVTAARADGKFSDNERKLVEQDAHVVIENMQALLREVARENEATHIRSVA